jgi:tricorn protease
MSSFALKIACFQMYFQYPTLHRDSLAFISSNVLWLSGIHKESWRSGQTSDVSIHNAIPRRLTETMENLRHPIFSPDGKTIAFVSTNDIYTISIDGGIPERITPYEKDVMILGWKDDRTLWVSGRSLQHANEKTLATVDVVTGHRQCVPIGPCEFFSVNAQGGQIIQRQGYGYSVWKRYQGGLTATLWIDPQGTGLFQRLLGDVKYNLLRPFWIDDRIYFLSDMDGHGNLHSCLVDGSDCRRHTNHTDFYPRHLTTFGNHLTYSCGGKIWIYDIQTHQSQAVPLHINQGALSKAIEHKNPATHLTSYQLSPDGKRISLTTRGRLFELTPFKGPVTQKGTRNGVRYRWSGWFKDKTLITLCDEGLNEVFESYQPDEITAITHRPSADWGRITTAKPNPQHHSLACTNHRHELILIQWSDIQKSQDTTTIIDRSEKSQVLGYAWSPCGRWIAYSIASRDRGANICIYDTIEHKKHTITDNAFMNAEPVFDPDGQYLFFLSSRIFDTQRDAADLAMACDDGAQPFVFILQNNQDSPFVLPLLHPEDADSDEKEKTAPIPTADASKNPSDADAGTSTTDTSKKDDKDAVKPTLIDFDNPTARILAFPLPAKAYSALDALKGQVLYCIDDEDGKKDLYAYDMKQLKEEMLISGLKSFSFSQDRQWMIYATDNKLRTVRAGSKPDDTPDTSFHQGGWLDWKRIALQVNPQSEWIHMFDEAWRLQKEMFWTPSMGQVNWQAVYERYRVCVDQITCSSELYSVIEDMQGELGTSHAYVYASSSATASHSPNLGSLGAEFSYDSDKKAYRIEAFLENDPWKPLPLKRPGLGLKTGDLIWAIAGQALSESIQPHHALVQQAGQSVPILVSDSSGENKRTLVVFPENSKNESRWRYRQWVESNRQWVHENSNHKIGYIHIPDMSPGGYSEFLRGYTQEVDRDGLIIDARYNGGGNLSCYMIDLLRRQRLGHDQSRHQGFFPYPSDAPKGPMVALINEFTGSDGDIFSHAFKTLKMGPLIGKRTWGGVVGIHTRYNLLDGTYTTQPEFSFWFAHVGWSVENHGVDPDIEIDITPYDYAQKQDPQLERGLKEVLAIVEKDGERQKPLMPSPGSEPVLKAPTLPNRPV